MAKQWNKYIAISAVLLSVVYLFTTAHAEDEQENTSPNSTQYYDELLSNNPDVVRKLAEIVQSNPELKAQLSKAIGEQPLPPAGYATANTVVPATSTTTVTTQSSSSSQNAQALPNGESSFNETETKVTVSEDESKMQIKQKAFESVKDEAFPLTPAQIKELHNMLDDTQRATAADPHDVAPEPTSSSTLVNLAPGSTPPVIRLARGFVTSLVFIDSTGAPWPIQAYDLGNPQAFDIQWNKKDNTLMVQARTSYTYGNLAVKLQTLDTPVMITLVPGQRMVDYRVDLRLHGLGPNAKPPTQGSSLPAQADPRLLSILDGIPPKGAKQLLVEGGDGAEAWLLNEKIYFRCRFMVLSPAWISEMSSADGMHAYEMPKTPMILVSRHGKTAQVRLEGF